MVADLIKADNSMEINFERKQTKKVRIGDVFIGGGSPVSVQSMTNTDTRDVKATVDQIKRLADAGCEIIRFAVPDMEAAQAVKAIRKQVKLPLVADIHFDYKLALECIKNGVDKIRLNPGNIGNREKVEEVVKLSRERDIPIRIGVNSGSVEKHILKKYGGVTAEGLVESALGHVRILEESGYDNIVLSLKASSVPMTIEAYRIASERTNYPLHLGVTESGTVSGGTVKSAIGIGALLAEGIGDTIRVSLTGDPVDEVKVGFQILKALGLKKGGVEIVSCPTCGRCRIDLADIAHRLEKILEGSSKNLKIAVMGCAVNGPGEAKEADIGIAGGDGEALLFKKGEAIRKIPQDSIIEAILKEVELF